MIANLERERDLPVGGIDLMPIIESAGLAVIRVDGVFVDYSIFYRAQRILATFAAIRDRGAEQGGAGAN